MILHRLAVSGTVPFPNPVTLDLSELDPSARVVAVVGPNGAGKSTLLSAWLRAMRMQTDGTLYRDAAAYEEADFTAPDGRRWIIKQYVDATKAQTKRMVLVTDSEGHTPSAVLSGKVRDFDAWAREHLPDAGTFMTSVFAAQGKDAPNFLDLSPAQRKDVLLRFLGIEHMETLAKGARAHEADASRAVDRIDARIEETQRGAGDVEQLSDALSLAALCVQSASAGLAQSKALREAELERHGTLLRAHQEASRAKESHAQARCAWSAAYARVEELEARMDSARAMVAGECEARQAAAAVVMLSALARAHEEKIVTLRAKYDEAQQRGLAENLHVRAHRAAAEIARRRSRSHDEAARELEPARNAAASVVELTTRLESARLALHEADRELDVARKAGLDSRDDRIVGLRSGLSEIGRGIAEPAVFAQHVVTVDDDALCEQAAAPQRLEDARADKVRAQGELDRASEQLRVASATAGRVEDIERRIAAAAEANQEAAAATEAAERHAGLFQEAEAEWGEQARLAAKEAEAAAPIKEELARMEPIAAKLPAIVAASSAVDAWMDSLTTAEQVLVEAQRVLDANPQPPPSEPVPDMSRFDADVQLRRDALEADKASVVRVQQRLEDARTAHARVDELYVSRSHAQQVVADWSRLALDLGRDGIQALEIDAAGPELTELANDLLHRAHGPRFTVAVLTTRISADGKRDLETCEVDVIDTVRGTQGNTDRLSGGERVLVGEAIRLALTTLSCRRAGIAGATLVRDETGAALDPEAGPAYVAMLRRAADLIGAQRVLFVSHSPELWSLADARIEVKDGAVSVSE